MKAKMTTGMMVEREAPRCPHCGGGNMDMATMTLGELISSWPLPARIETERDGHVWETHHLALVDCPDCGKPSALAIAPGPSDTAKLIAARTPADLAYFRRLFDPGEA